MSENYFQMKDLSVGYHGNVLIHDICTEIKKGEILTLIGLYPYNLFTQPSFYL